jgi:hypothetical protein
MQYCIVFALAYSYLILASRWSWFQDGFKTFTERSEEIFQESVGSLRELTSNVPRIYSAFGTIEESDNAVVAHLSDDPLADPISDESNYEISLGDSSSVPNLALHTKIYCLST